MSLQFQFTFPVWGASTLIDHLVDNFQFTLPAWEARSENMTDAEIMAFQFTLPVWGAHGICCSKAQNDAASIHAPRMGSTAVHMLLFVNLTSFNSRFPHGEHEL